jgi:hypothetical protein
MYLCGWTARTSAELECKDVPYARMAGEVDVLCVAHSLDHCII